MLNLLRLREGFALAAFEARTGLLRAAIAAPLAEAAAAGWLEVGDERVRPTEAGLRLANDVIALFLPAPGPADAAHAAGAHGDAP